MQWPGPRQLSSLRHCALAQVRTCLPVGGARDGVLPGTAGDALHGDAWRRARGADGWCGTAQDEAGGGCGRGGWRASPPARRGRRPTARRWWDREGLRRPTRPGPGAREGHGQQEREAQGCGTEPANREENDVPWPLNAIAGATRSTSSRGLPSRAAGESYGGGAGRLERRATAGRPRARLPRDGGSSVRTGSPHRAAAGGLRGPGSGAPGARDAPPGSCFPVASRNRPARPAGLPCRWSTGRAPPTRIPTPSRERDPPGCDRLPAAGPRGGAHRRDRRLALAEPTNLRGGRGRCVHTLYMGATHVISVASDGLAALDAIRPCLRVPSECAPLSLLAVGARAPGCRADDAAAATRPREAAAPVHVQTATVVDRPMPELLDPDGHPARERDERHRRRRRGKVVRRSVERGQPVKPRAGHRRRRRAGRDAHDHGRGRRRPRSPRASSRRRGATASGSSTCSTPGAISQAEFDRQTAQCTAQQWSATAAEAQQQSAHASSRATPTSAPRSTGSSASGT